MSDDNMMTEEEKKAEAERLKEEAEEKAKVERLKKEAEEKAEGDRLKREADEKDRLVKEFLAMKGALAIEGDQLYQNVLNYNEKVSKANAICEKYSRLVPRGEKLRIDRMKPYTLSKNMPSGNKRNRRN